MHAWQEESGAGGSAFAYLLERAHAVRRAARWAWRYEALGAEEVARAGVRQLAAVADVVVTGGGGAAAALDSAPDPVLRGLNVLLSTFEDENESESEGVEGEGFDDDSDYDGGWQWGSDGEGEAVGAGA